MESQEYVSIISRRGHFNFADPSQESVSTNISIVSPNGEVKSSCNIHTEQELDRYLAIDYIVNEIDLYLERWHSTDQSDILAMREYLVENETPLSIGALQREKTELASKMDAISERIAAIDRNLGFYEVVS